MTGLISIIIPVYNEAENLRALYRRSADLLAKECPAFTFEFIFIDDGSSDATLPTLRAMHLEYESVKFLSFSRNFGHQYALKAGIDHAFGDAVISMDGDGQHPPELIPTLIKEWQQGYDVVYTIRLEDAQLPYRKRRSSLLFYRLINHLSDIAIEPGSADFRLISADVARQLRALQEQDIFFRGMIKWMGFRQIAIPYEPAERMAGESKYTVKKMMRLALQGITGFSTKPLYAATYLGLLFSIASLLYLPYALYSYFFTNTLNGWTSMIVTIAFFGGLQLMMLGIIGLYLGKLFMQAKGRPLYVVQEKVL